MICETIHLNQENPEVALQTYVLQDSAEILAGGKRPAVIICPGGAHFICSEREGEPAALAFARMGYHAFVLNYSVYGTEGFSAGPKGIAQKPRQMHPAPLRDLGRAMLYVRSRAEEWHIDTENIAVCGFSAGGHNAALYATDWYKPVLTEYLHCEAEQLRPAACVLAYATTDYRLMKEAFAKRNHIPSVVFIGPDWKSDEKVAELSPAMRVTEQTPPTFIWATSEDKMVPVQHSISMANALAQAGVPFELHIFEKGPHGQSTCDRLSAPSAEELRPDNARWTELCDAFLQRHLKLDLPAVTPKRRVLL